MWLLLLHSPNTRIEAAWIKCQLALQFLVQVGAVVLLVVLLRVRNKCGLVQAVMMQMLLLMVLRMLLVLLLPPVAVVETWHFLLVPVVQPIDCLPIVLAAMATHCQM